MPAPTLAVTCPSCGLSRDFPLEKFPPRPLTITCRSCGHAFRFTKHQEAVAAVAAGLPEPAPSAMHSPAPGNAGPSSPDRRSPRPPAKAGFVDTLAWIFIVLAGFATFISVLQNVMIATMFPLDKVHETVNSPGAQKQMPALFRFLFNHFQLYFAAFLVLSAVTLASAVGLLKRKNWARMVFIVLMALGIAWNVAGVVLQQVIVSSFPTFPGASPTEFRDRFETMLTLIRIFSVLMTVGMSVLFGWIIKRLVSPEIRGEFA